MLGFRTDGMLRIFSVDVAFLRAYALRADILTKIQN